VPEHVLQHIERLVYVYACVCVCLCVCACVSFCLCVCVCVCVVSDHLGEECQNMFSYVWQHTERVLCAENHVFMITNNLFLIIISFF